MRAYELWGGLSPELNHTILETAYFHNKKLYRTLIEDMARNLRQRVKRLLDTPRAERHIMFQPVLNLPLFDILTQNLLMNWLLHAEHKMLAGFLDELGIAHDGMGRVDMLPKTVDEARLEKAVQSIYEKFNPESVTVYLKTFDVIGGQPWPVMKFVREK